MENAPSRNAVAPSVDAEPAAGSGPATASTLNEARPAVSITLSK